MLYFAAIKYLWLLLLVPLLPLIYALSLRMRRSRLEKLGDPAAAARPSSTENTSFKNASRSVSSMLRRL